MEDQEIQAGKGNANRDPAHNPHAEDFLVVGIGASAGGIAALKAFFENVPADSGCAYVVILHLSPDFESKLAEILQQASVIPVEQVREDKVKVKPNHAYVVPPGKSMQMAGGSLLLSPVITHDQRRAPIDIFFRTLAENYDGRSVAVILSGTGADGSMGMKRVKEMGGIVLVQEPREAEYPDMPKAAIATSLVDDVLPAAALPEKIGKYRGHLLSTQQMVHIEAGDTIAERHEAAMREIFTHLRVRTGHDFSSYKRATVMRRISRRMSVREIDHLHDYAQIIKDNHEEATALLKDLLISVTNFFRDREAWEHLEQKIIPAILEGKGGTDTVRMWVAGCATGEEAYSLAMLFAEALENIGDPPTVQIFATDIDDDAITHARDGVYNNADVADVSPERLRRFFIEEEGGYYRVRREIRESILFARHNVLRDPAFNKLSLATCRNLLIYLNKTAQTRVLQTVHFAMLPGGYLMLGSAEGIDGTGDLYVTLDREQNIYQSRAVQNRPIPPPPDVPFAYRAATSNRESLLTGITRSADKLSLATLHYQVLEHYAPPSVLVNADYDIVHLSERAGQYLQISGGEPSYNLLKAVRPELRMELRAALYAAQQGSTVTRSSPITIQIGAEAGTVTIMVRPVIDPTDNARGFLLVLFERGEVAIDAEEVKLTLGPDGLAQQLEAELVRTRTQLRSTTEQYEIQTEELRASNEELQAINEELRSSAEELETGKEELQSVNEELTTVNQELKIKIDELSQSNNDFQNLMAATDIGTVFLDRAFNVKLFTPAAQDIFNLLPGDYGRPLSDITHRLRETNLMADAEAVMQRLVPIEREVHTDNGKAFLMRLTPYRTQEDRISGVVATFINITRRVEAEGALRTSETRFRTMTDAIPQLVWTNESAGVANYFNKRWYEYSGLTYEESFGPGWQAMVHPDDAAQSIDKWQHALRSGEVFDTEYRLRRADGVYRWFIGRNVPLRDEAGRVIAWFGSATDIDDLKQAEAARRQSEESVRLIMESVRDYAIYTTDLERRVMSWNAGAEAIFGYTPEEIIGQSHDIIFTTEDIGAGVPETEARAALEHGRAANERWHLRKDGSRFYASGVMNVLHNGHVHGYAKVARDLTERKQAEEAIQESEARLRIAIEAADMGTWDLDIKTGLVHWNEHHFRLFGMEPRMEPLTLDEFFEHVHPEYHKPMRAEIDRVLREGGIFEMEFCAIMADGSTRWMSDYGNVLMDAEGNAIRASGVMMDIHERKTAEEALRTSEQRYHAFVQQSTEGIWRFEMRQPVPIDLPAEEQIALVYEHAYLAECNDAMAAIYGYSSAEEIIGLPIERFLPRNEGINTYLKHFIQSGYRVVNTESRERTKDGRDVYFISNLIGVVEDGYIKRAWGTQSDITARKELERHKDEFIGVASHELRTPVTSIKAYAETLYDMLTVSGDSGMAELAIKLDQQVDRLRTLIHDLLDATRLTEGGGLFVQEPFDLNALIGETVETLQRSSKTHVIESKLDALPTVHGDRARIQQVLTNLLANAIKYSPQADRIVVRAAHDEGRIVVSVEDFGIGIKEDVQAQIFERFFRAPDSEISTYPGLGLGLYIATEIVKRHGGEMWVESKRGSGSTFYFSLPTF